MVNGVYLPDKENYLPKDIVVSPYFAGAGTVQFKKFQRAFVEIRNWRHAVDIGANCGIWTRVMARCFERVTCFEPNPECHEAFWANNPCKNGSFIQLHKVALGNVEGETKLNTVTEKSTAFSRIDGTDGDVAVIIRTLDSYELEDVDFIKIDVEGYEHLIVKGALDTIKRCRPVMIVEQKPDNAERHGLKQYGAVNLLKKLGMKEAAQISGDFIMVW